MSAPNTTDRSGDAVNSFMASGGDIFLVLPGGTNRVVGQWTWTPSSRM